MKKCKRLMTCVSLALCAALLLPDPRTAQAAGSDKTYEQYRSGGEAGQRKESDYIQIHISTEEELAELAENCELDSWSVDKYVILDGDIVLKEHSGLMIPGFGGIFDGCGYGISNLELEDSGSGVGLFRYVRQGAVIRNLSVSGRVHPGGSQSQVGILAGVNYGEIINCSVSGSVTGARAAGGLVGVNQASGEIRRCSSGALVSGDHSAGGICGENYGTLNNCSNSGKINTCGKEVIYDLEDITLENLESINDMSNVGAHTDTGGIAGYSEGKIYYCSNTGTVGYRHVGYNTGGIVGRLHQGYVQNCTNEGEICGRKDTGGIAGQMEPFLEIQYLNDKLSEIDRETEKLFDLMDAAHEDLNRYSSQTASLTKALTESLRKASDAAGFLGQTTNELWYLYNQELTGVGDDLKRLSTELQDADSYKEYTVSGGDAGDLTIRVPDDYDSYKAALRRFGDSTGTHLTNMTKASSDRSGGITGNLEILDRELDAAGNTLWQLSDVLTEGTETTGDNIDAVAEQMRVLRRCVNELRNDLFRYEGITVEDTSDEAASREPGTPGAVEGETGTSGQEQGEEARYDTSSFQQGKITLCVNRGSVTADANVGGIVGQIATEYDFDPEDDITLSGEESFHIEQTVKAVVRESRNYGEITGKKDYVGGVVGRADFGAVISCESYGGVSSTGGSYVGGIAGASSYAVRSCSFLGSLSGKNYVGGIAGRGCDIFYSYACPTLELSGEFGGSVAGGLEDEGILKGNYYAKGNIAGVDAVGYDGGATPVAYEELCRMEGVPAAFTEFTVVFRADGRELASFACGYGDAIQEADIPEVPGKEGFYGSWPEADYGFITGNLIFDAVYQPWVTSIAGGGEDENGRTMILAQGNFRSGAQLLLTQEGEQNRLDIVYTDENGNVTQRYEDPILVRILCEDTEHTAVELEQDGSWVQAETAVLGSYLEFSMDKPGIYRVTIMQDRGKMEGMILIAGCCVLAVLLLIVVGLLGRRRKKRAGKKEEGTQGAEK